MEVSLVQLEKHVLKIDWSTAPIYLFVVQFRLRRLLWNIDECISVFNTVCSAALARSSLVVAIYVANKWIDVCGLRRNCNCLGALAQLSYRMHICPLGSSSFGLFCNSTRRIIHIITILLHSSCHLRCIECTHTHYTPGRARSQSINIYFSEMRTNLIWIDCLFENEMYRSQQRATLTHTHPPHAK